jgi:phage I-like protein
MESICTSIHRDLAPLGDAKTTWIHIVPVGEFPGTVNIPAGYQVPGWGTAEEDMEVEGLTVVDERGIQSMLQRFRGDMLIDQDHLSHDSDRDTEAMGWGLNLRRAATGDGLELETEWTPPGREKIKGKVYRKISPEFHGSVRFESGTFKFFPSSLTGAGLTNRPNLKSLRPVSANRQQQQHNTPMKQALQLLCGLIGAPETATEQELQAKYDAFKNDVVTSKNRAAEADRLEQENKKLQSAAIDADLIRFADVIEDADATKELLQLNREATVKDLTARLAKVKGKTTGDGTPAPVFQQNRATAPDGKKFATTEDEPDEAASAKYRQAEARAHTLATAERIPFSLAFDKAKAELGL